MSTVRESARVRPLADTFEDTKAKAWQVWDVARSRAQAQGAQSLRGPLALPGFRLRGAMSELIRIAFPASRMYGEDDFKKFSSGINAHLKATNNAICTSRSNPVTWWVSATWNGSAADHERYESRAEEVARKLTPHEAGEDRPAAAVSVIRRPHAPAAVENERVEKILALLKQHAEPLATMEIATALDDTRPPHPSEKYNVTMPVVGHGTISTLRDLVKQKKIFRRIETPGERKLRSGLGTDDHPVGRGSTLYSLRNPVPPRTVRNVTGYLLETTSLPKNAGAYAAAVRDERNEIVLNALLKLRQPADVKRLMRLTKLTRSRVERALLELADAGMAHHGPHKQTGREWLPIDHAFPTATKETKVLKPDVTGTQLAIVKAALEFGDAGEDFTAIELAEVTGFHDSTCREAIKARPAVFERTGTNRNRSHVFRVVDAAVKVKEEARRIDATPPAGAQDPAYAVAQLAEALGVHLGGNPAREAELEGQVADLTERLLKAKAQIRALTEV